ncbi:response regulator aspartate phosphatase [Bacillus sp. BP-3]|uniref:response regulator aspartate phosphatase n=1 Tax=Bacillus sp. BP-3 TaxID=3022773 RepID=UPI00232F4EA4|nr:tetratricopeptide repeat protein [Bacillus sp. BP-3]MDC2867738.1 tetratricopeptide repeat protein [Bacillus sp. BP-3]
MNVQIITKDYIKNLLNKWYQEMRSQNIVKAQEIKQEIDMKIHQIEDEEILLHYSLLVFRYNMLSADFYPQNSNVDTKCLKEINLYNTPKDKTLAYYYHFFKGAHETTLGNFKVAEKHYEKAHEFIDHVHDVIEKAEFYFKLASFSYYIQQPLDAVEYATKARKIFSEQHGYELKVAACQNVLGLACVELEQYEQAEVFLTTAMSILQKENEEALMLRVRHSLGVMYAEQDLSDLAIRYLSEVSREIPDHFRAIFLEAREYYKIDENKIASELIEKGLEICNELDNEEYKHHFAILKSMNEKVTAEQLEKAVLEGFSFFKKEGLFQYLFEYSSKLAMHFHEEGNHSKASEYFYFIHKEKGKFKRGALK